MVTRQYEALPYPPVSNDDIKKEEEFYRNDQQSKLMYSYPTITLENLNHFLFRGNEDFRQVHIIIQSLTYELLLGYTLRKV